MASLDEILAARQNAATSLALPTLPVPKTKLEEKKERLFGGSETAEPGIPAPADNSLLQFMNGGSADTMPGYGDRFQAGLARGGGSLADMGKSVSNAVFGSEFDDSVETGWSRPEDQENRIPSAADQAAGISYDQRDNVNQQLQGVMDDYVEGDWLGAAGGALRAAPGLAMDSGVSLVELGAGALATPIAGAGAGLLAKKAKNIYDTVNKIGDSYNAAKEAQAASKIADNLAKVAGGAASRISQSSFLAADIIQQTKVEYEQETGEEMSPARLLGTTAMTMATTAFYPDIIKKFYMPRIRTPAGKTLADKYHSEVKRVLAYADRGVVNSVARRIGSGAGKVFQAGGAEAVQEYAQNWAQILSVHMDPEEAGGLFQSAYNEFADEENQNNAEVAALLGAAAGGTIRAATAAPSVATGAAADVGVKSAQAVGRRVQEAARINLTPEDQQTLDDQIAGMRAATDEITKENSRKVEVIGNSKSFSDINDETVREDFVAGAQGRDLSDPRVYKLVSDKLIRSYKKDTVVSETATRTKSGYETGKAKTKQVYRDLPVSEEMKESVAKKAAELVQDTKDLSAAFVEDISNFKTSATLGVAEAAVDFVADTTKSGSKKVSSSRAAKNLRERLNSAGSTVSNVRSVANKIAESAPLTARELNRWADSKETSAKKLGVKKDTFVNYESLGDSIKQASQSKSKVTSPLALAQDLREVTKGTIENIDTLRAVENSISNYESSNFQGEGKLTESWISTVRRKLADRQSELEAQGSKLDQVKETASKVASTVKEKTAPVTDKIKSAMVAGLEAVVERVVNEDVFTAEDNKLQKKILTGLSDDVKRKMEAPRTEEEVKSELTDEQIISARAAVIMKEQLGRPGMIENLSKVFKTSNPEFIASIIEDIFPLSRTKGIGDNLMQSIKTALEGSTQPNTEPTRRRKAPKKAKDTDQEATSDSEVVIEEDGAVFKRKPDAAKARSAFEKLLGSLNVCKAS